MKPFVPSPDFDPTENDGRVTPLSASNPCRCADAPADPAPSAYTGPFPVRTGPALDGSFVSAVYMPSKKDRADVVRVFVCEGGHQLLRYIDFSVHEALRIRDALNLALEARAIGMEILAHEQVTGSGVGS